MSSSQVIHRFSVCMFSVGMFPASSYFANVISRADVCQQSSNDNDCLRFRKQFPHTYFYACWGYCHSNQKVRNPESDYFLKHVLFEMEPSKIIQILERSVFRIPQKLWLGVEVFNYLPVQRLRKPLHKVMAECWGTLRFQYLSIALSQK